MSFPLVSVCIPTYNHERYIRQCLDGVLMQSADLSLEVLVGDDASTDGTEAIVRGFAERFPTIVRYIRNNERKGPSGNMRFLIREARGAYIAHLDGDDFWLPGKLAAQIGFLEAHSDTPAVYSNAFCISDDGLPRGIFTDFEDGFVHATDLVRRGNFLNHSSMVYRAGLREALLNTNESRLDFHVHLILASYGALGYLPAPLTVYRLSSNTSILVHSNSHVRELYWQALRENAPSLVTAEDLSTGMAEFMRSIFFRSLKLRSPRLIASWWPRILGEAPMGKTRLLAQACFAIFRAGIRGLFSNICERTVCNKMKVLYPK